MAKGYKRNGINLLVVQYELNFSCLAFPHSGYYYLDLSGNKKAVQWKVIISSSLRTTLGMEKF
jgi:hypothetical protein